MRKRSLGRDFAIAIAATAIFASALVAQQPRNRQPAQPAAGTNLRVKYRTTTAGQSMENTTMVKGPRERSEVRMGYGMEIINITQCDLKRTIQISDKAKKYVVTSMDTDVTPSPASRPASARPTPEPVTRGGVVTYVISSIDTGERKDMFGFKARHVKTTMSMNSSPEACSKVNQKIETDGWYIDLPARLNCDMGRAQAVTPPPVAPGGCRDRVVFDQKGTGRTGFPLEETTTMYGPDGQVMFTSSKEVIDISTAPLDAALFDIPVGYAETQNAQELYVMPSANEMMAQANANERTQNSRTEPASSGNSKRAGTIRVGVVQFGNKSGKDVSAESLRARLISEIQSGNVEAVPLNASMSRTEAELEAKEKQCDFILFTEIATLKTNKLGGMFGRVTGVTGVAKTEAKVEYKLFAVGETSPRLQSSATAKEEGEDVSAGAALTQEARAVSAELRKGGGD